jgi:heme o synthase
MPEIESERSIPIARSRLVDYLALTKPELTLLSVITADAGVLFASRGPIPVGVLANVMVGTALVGGGVGALNQLIERKFDAMMRRTEHRPLPAGRLTPAEVTIFGTGLVALGIADLVVFTNPLAGVLAALTLVTYLFVYTPLKRKTPWATFVGGIPGGLPPVIGCAAVRNEFTVEAWLLFALLFFWQMPHFMSLAWMYRKDYARAGYKMLTVVEPSGAVASIHILVFSVLLLVASLLPAMLGYTGKIYVGVALFLSIGFMVTGIRFRLARSNEAARQVFFLSLVYLPVLLLVLVIERL